MKKEDIAHLANLARINTTDAEQEALATEISDIIGYVSQVNEIAGEVIEKQVPEHHNIFREDTDPHEAGVFTETLLEAAPEREGQYVVVKKIISQE